MIKDEIHEEFLSKLGDSDEINESLLFRLNEILTKDNKPKADDLVSAYEEYRRSDKE